MLHFIIVFILAVATGCGIGGGGIYTVYLVSLENLTQNGAQAANLTLFLISASVSAVYLLKNGGVNVIRAALICSVFAIPGVFLGTYLRTALPEVYIRKIFALFLISAGIFVFLNTLIKRIKKKVLTKRK